MGKVRTRFFGIDEIEEQQKKEQKERAERKKTEQSSEEVAEDTEAQQKETKKKQKKIVPSIAARKHGKKFADARKKINPKTSYKLPDAIELLKKVSFAKFDESVELHLNLFKEGLRGEVSLPHSTGRTVRVVVLDDAVLKDIENGTIEFDVLIAHPSQMPKIAKFARTLGPKGLMPNPKAGTVSAEPEKTAEKFKKGSLRWKSESKAPLIHQMIAKLSAEPSQIEENATAFMESVGYKNIKDAYIAATMTPSIKLEIQSE